MLICFFVIQFVISLLKAVTNSPKISTEKLQEIVDFWYMC